MAPSLTLAFGSKTTRAMLSDVQKDRVRALLDDSWVSEDEERSQTNLRELLGHVESREELHVFAGRFNWDGGSEELREVLAHPLCDRGTALMIYWLTKPDYFYRRLEKHGALLPYELEAYSFMKDVERHLIACTHDAEIAFDPADIVRRKIADDDPYRPGLRLIPPALKQPTKGKVVDLFQLHDTACQ